MSTLQRAEAVVLNVTNHGDADKIVTLYGRDQGKFTGIAKGALRSRKRFVNKLELFSRLEINYEEGRTSSLVRIDQAELLDGYPAIRREYPRYAAASLVGELVGLATREHDADPRIFALLTWALAAIADDPSLPRSAVFFNLKLLELLGYRPRLEGCLACGSLEPAGRPYHFSLGRSGLLCQGCNREAGHGLVPVSLPTIRLLAKGQDLAIAKLDRLLFPPEALREAVTLLRHYQRHLLQREIRSWQGFLQAIGW